MTVQIRIPVVFRTITGGTKVVPVEGDTVGQALGHLFTEYPALQARMMGDNDELKRSINVFVGEEDIRYTGGLDTALTDGAEVAIMPPVAGG